MPFTNINLLNKCYPTQSIRITLHYSKLLRCNGTQHQWRRKCRRTLFTNIEQLRGWWLIYLLINFTCRQKMSAAPIADWLEIWVETQWKFISLYFLNYLIFVYFICLFYRGINRPWRRNTSMDSGKILFDS